MSTSDDPNDLQADHTRQEPAEGSRETVEAALGDESRIDDPGSGVSDDVPDA